MNHVSATQWRELSENEAYQIIDVRTEFEFAAENIPGSINIPLDQISLEKLNAMKVSNKILLICQSGVRSHKAAQKISAYTDDILSFEGGINSWKEDGLQLIQHKKVISLERQVRICAGLLILTGIILMKLGFSGAEYLSAFVGAGLVFAGISDTCGMGILLSKMPWNKS